MINEWSENRPITAATRSERWRPAPFGVLGDERLAQRAGAGDDRAFAVVYQRYHQILSRYCRSILNNDADAQDALQSTFAAAFASLRAGQRDAPMRPWLFRIAHNESISILRRRRPAVELSQAPEHATSSIDSMRMDARSAAGGSGPHLRECDGCAAFAAAIPARTGELRALAQALPGVAGAGLLGRIAVSSAGRSGGAGLARLAAGAVAKTASASTGFGANALAGVAVVATATAGVTVGVGKLVQEMPRRETVRRGVYAPPRPARTAPGAPGSLLGAAARPRARAAGVPGGATTGTRTRTTSSHRTVVGDRWSGGDTRPVRIDGSNVGKGSVSSGAGGQAGPGAAFSDGDGHGWWGAPAQARSDQAGPPSAPASAAAGSVGSTHGSGKSNHGSGNPSWAAPRQSGSGTSSSHGSDPSAGTSPSTSL